MRVLKMFDKFGIKSTFFVPGHSLETFPREMAAVRDAGHEMGLHGYSHENPNELSREQEEAITKKTSQLLTDFCHGKRPRGYVAPWWNTSARVVEMLLSHGVEYDHSMMHHDCQPYYLRTGDTWEKIDYSKPAETWMKPWYLDDATPMMYIPSAPNTHGYVSPRDIEQLWKDQFDYFYREYDEFVFPMTVHPDVAGRPQCILMHERLISYFNSKPGVEWVTMGQICDDFKAKNKRE
ncbi:glycoside hydrolase/deacetylase [Gonapodya prolifera JEL478]|uniref:Glycoside hydrolase/deacetylase n=1 Tax=Gonapodya prolifera (strain JEL478) TaxID=1344416 RepID=A0A138ZZL7_GONPJ|nr:glycoside hydrolase/deacetylase [Gonapodya prolifera JEL478]|eukprot:KXS09715.1 glycoside hydrolase/deacetylase [Gonapodya prolifera JEL478]